MTPQNIAIKNVTCPECGHDFDPSQAVSAEMMEVIQTTFRAQWEEEQGADTEAKAEARAAEIVAESMEPVAAELSKMRKENLALKLAETQQKALLDTYEDEKLNEIEAAKIEARAEERKQGRLEADLRVNEVEEKYKQLQDKVAKLETAKSASSSQLVGEAGENWVHDILTTNFPTDQIIEVKKGAKGADWLWEICPRGARPICTVHIEVKSTANFQNAWTGKLKEDMANSHKAIGVIVSKAMPKDRENMHYEQGIWIVPFHEFELLAKFLRHMHLKLDTAAAQSIARESNATDLFDFIAGPVFARCMERLLQPIIKGQETLKKDQNFSNKQWRDREAQLKQQFDAACQLAANLEALLGTTIAANLGFDEFNLLTNIDGEDT